MVRDNKIAYMTTSGRITKKVRDKVLMIYHNIYDSWTWVEGHVDGDEDLMHVVKKIEEDENSGVKWVNIDKVLEYSTEEKMKSIYQRLINKMKKINYLVYLFFIIIFILSVHIAFIYSEFVLIFISTS